MYIGENKNYNFFSDLADGKDTLIKKYGYTKDIIKCVVDVFNETKDQCEGFCEHFRGGSVRETCVNIANFVCSNIRYKADPEGVQWIKTPYRFLADLEGDCKSYSLFICAVLSCLGIKNYFRFASYGKGREFTHVYSVAEDERSNELIIDCVAIQQGKANLFEEVKYTKMKNILNSTKISVLSGFESDNIKFSATDTIAQITAKCYYYALTDTNKEDLAHFLLWVVDAYKKQKELEIASYIFAMFAKNLKMGLTTAKNLCKNFIADVGKTNSPYNIADLDETQYDEDARFWFNQNITAYCGMSYNYDVTEVFKTIVNCCVGGLYLFAPTNKLTTTQRTKQHNEYTLFNAIAQNSGITEQAYKFILFGAIMRKFGESPEDVLKDLFPKQFATISGICGNSVTWDPLNGTIFSPTTTTTTPTTTNNTTTQSTTTTKGDKATTILNTINDSLTSLSSVFSSFFGGKSTKNVIPQQTDYKTSSDNSLFIIGAVGVLAFGVFALVSKKKKKGAKR